MVIVNTLLNSLCSLKNADFFE